MLGIAYEWYIQCAFLATIMAVVLINLKTLPGVWHVSGMNEPANLGRKFKFLLC